MRGTSWQTRLTCTALAWATAVCIAADDTPLTDKTLVVWASPANLTQSGGTALTVNDATIDRFDGVVFAEIEPRVWMPGSNGFSRTSKEQADWPKETAGIRLAVSLRTLRRRCARSPRQSESAARPAGSWPGCRPLADRMHRTARDCRLR